MKDTSILQKRTRPLLSMTWKKFILFLSVFGPATITAMADNDAGGVATYSIAGAKLGYPILFPLVLITILLGVTQEMGMRLTIVTRRGLADLIREKYGVKVALFMFGSLLFANMATLITELSAVKITSAMLNLPAIPSVILIVLVSFLFITRGNYKLTEKIMLFSSLFFLSYIISAVLARPDWGMAFSNLVYPHGVDWTPTYRRNFLLIGMGVLGTTITPWGQFFISSFAYDKKIEQGKVSYSQIETYWGAFLTDLLFVLYDRCHCRDACLPHNIPLVSGEQAALAIEPFAGHLAGMLFAVGILNAGFMGLVIVSLSTAYAFAEFFGLSGSLNDTFKESKTFYVLFIIQLVIALLVSVLPDIRLFELAVFTQTINAVSLPFVFYYLIKLTSDKELMGEYANNRFQFYFSIICTVVIVVASLFTMVTVIRGM